MINQANMRYSASDVGAHWVVSVDPTRGPSGDPIGCHAVVEFWLNGEHVSTDVGFTPFAFRRDSDTVTADMYDMAYKGAVTDGMKRAMRIMGAQFGNSLYGGESAPQRQDAPAPHPMVSGPPAAPAMPKPFAGKPDTPAPSGAVCACGKNKRAEYPLCYTCNQARR